MSSTSYDLFAISRKIREVQPDTLTLVSTVEKLKMFVKDLSAPDAITAVAVAIDANDWVGQVNRRVDAILTACKDLDSALEDLRNDLPELEDLVSDAEHCVVEKVDLDTVIEILNENLFETEMRGLSEATIKRRWLAGELPEPFTSESDFNPHDVEYLQLDHGIYCPDELNGGHEWVKLVPSPKNPANRGAEEA